MSALPDPPSSPFGPDPDAPRAPGRDRTDSKENGRDREAPREADRDRVTPPSPREGRTPGGRRMGDLRGPGGRRINLWYVLIAVWLVVLLWQTWSTNRNTETIPYSTFLEYRDAGRITDLKVMRDQITGTLKDPAEGHPDKFVTTRVDPELAKDLEQHGVDFTGVIEDTWLSELLALVLPILVIVAIWMFMFRRMAGKGGMGGGFMSVGKSKARIYVEEAIKVRFDDVAGADEAKQELEEIIGFLKEPGRYGRLGARLPKGILLVGPPGTGKTLMARAVAGEAGVPFFSISGSEFVEMFVGVGAARVRDLFEQARQRAPCIIFIDELDALGRARGMAGPMGGGHDEKEQTLNQLLVELDGFDPSTGVVLLAATNRPEILDPALLRAGRFDRQVLMDRPDKPARVQILQVHLRKVDTADDFDPEQVAALTPGFTGADIANLANEAAILATRRGAAKVSMDDFTRAIERIVAGLEKRNRLLNPHERKVTAFHEMGHALVSKALTTTDVVHKVSIIPRGIGALGYTIQRPTEDRFLMTREELRDKMAVLLGGRAAESLVFDEVSTGASDDLAKATDIARSMVTRYGMDEGLGQVSLESERGHFLPGMEDGWPSPRRYSEETAREIDCAVRELVDGAFRRATAILTVNRGALDTGAEHLLEKETLLGEELPEVVPAGER